MTGFTVNAERRGYLASLKVGDEVTRMLAGTIPVQLMVTAITETEIQAGAWWFHKVTGGEIDEDLGWDGGLTGPTGSFLKTPECKNEK